MPLRYAHSPLTARPHAAPGVVAGYPYLPERRMIRLICMVAQVGAPFGVAYCAHGGFGAAAVAACVLLALQWSYGYAVAARTLERLNARCTRATGGGGERASRPESR